MTTEQPFCNYLIDVRFTPNAEDGMAYGLTIVLPWKDGGAIHAIFSEHLLTCSEATGFARDIWDTDKVSLGVGSDLTFYSKPAILDPVYGQRPVSWKLFFRIRPGKMDMSMHGMHGGTQTPPSGQPQQ